MGTLADRSQSILQSTHAQARQTKPRLRVTLSSEREAEKACFVSLFEPHASVAPWVSARCRPGGELKAPWLGLSAPTHAPAPIFCRRLGPDWESQPLYRMFHEDLTDIFGTIAIFAFGKHVCGAWQSTVWSAESFPHCESDVGPHTAKLAVRPHEITVEREPLRFAWTKRARA